MESFSFIKLGLSNTTCKNVIDLWLYHRSLQCLIAIDLKIEEFAPEHKGKMEFYLSVWNDTVKLPHESPAIGIITCKTKNRTVVEYSLQSSNLPIGVATYNTSAILPIAYKTILPDANNINDKLMFLLNQDDEL